MEVLAQKPEFGKGALEQAANLSRRIDKTLDWAQIEWLRDRWKGKLVIKGILDPDDAIKARSVGADATVDFFRGEDGEASWQGQGDKS